MFPPEMENSVQSEKNFLGAGEREDGDVWKADKSTGEMQFGKS